MPGAASRATGSDMAPGQNTSMQPVKTVNSLSSSLPPLATLLPYIRQLGSYAATMA